MNSVTQLRGPIHLGMDVAKDAIAVGILARDEQTPVVERIFHDEASIRRLIAKFPDRGGVRACYEAGPTGYGLHRMLASMGVACDVVAPALTPRRAGDRVKTDRRDAQRLARLHRDGELTAIRVPSAFEEAIRDPCRARGDLVEDRRRMRQRLKAFLLRHDRVYRDGQSWTGRHEQRLSAQHFDDAALHAAYAPGRDARISLQVGLLRRTIGCRVDRRYGRRNPDRQCRRRHRCHSRLHDGRGCL